jgi:hypothetical protein
MSRDLLWGRRKRIARFVCKHDLPVILSKGRGIYAQIIFEFKEREKSVINQAPTPHGSLGMA